MRLGILREIKAVHKFFENMERNVKSRNILATQKAYTFLKILTYHMDDGDLTPEYVNYHLELAIALQDLDEKERFLQGANE